MFGYVVAIVLGLAIFILFIDRKPLNAVLLFLFARPAAQPLLDTGSYISGVPATGVLAVMFLGSSVLYVATTIKKNHHNSLPFFSLYVFLIFAIFSTIFSENIFVSMGALLRLMIWIMLGYLIITNAKSISSCQKILVAILLGSLPAVFYGIFQLNFSELQYSAGGLYVTSFFVTANAYGIYISLSIFCAVLLLHLQITDKARVYIYILLLLYAFSLIFTMHRASWLLMSIAMLALYKDNLKNIKSYLGMAVIFIVAIYYSDLISSRLFEVFEERMYGKSSLASRVNTWMAMLSEISDNIFRIFFVGFGTGIATSTRIITGLVPHNDYLRLLYEIGLFGLLSYLSFLLLSLRKCFFRIKNTTNKDKKIHLLVLYMLIYFIVISFTQNNVYDVRNMSIFIAIISIGAVLHKLRYNKQSVI